MRKELNLSYQFIKINKKRPSCDTWPFGIFKELNPIGCNGTKA